MQRKSPLLGVTIRFGVFSSGWNGQSPVQLLPCFFKVVPRDWMSAMRSVSDLIRSMVDSSILGIGLVLGWNQKTSRATVSTKRRADWLTF